MKKIILLSLFLFAFALFPVEQNIKNVLKSMSWKSFSADMTLKLKRKGKESIIKKMALKALEDKEGQKILAVFTFPSNMKGMAFLAHCNKNLKDKRFIYLRALRRVKKVPATGENFMLRDFLSLYLLKPRIELWNYKLLSSDDKQAVVEAMAKNDKTVEITGYKKLVLYVSLKGNYIEKTEFYSKDLKLRRVQKVLSVKVVDGVTFIDKMLTDDLDEGVKAEIILDNIKLKGISKKVFTVRYLKTL